MGAYRDEMELALMMAGEAGKIILPHFRDAASLRVEMKADNSPVTIADRSAEEALRKLMDLHTPGYGIIGEEFGSAAGRIHAHTVSGDVKVQFQADLFNVLNHTNLRFSSQVLNLSSGGFGQVTVAAPPRNVQLGMRVTF